MRREGRRRVRRVRPRSGLSRGGGGHGEGEVLVEHCEAGDVPVAREARSRRPGVGNVAVAESLDRGGTFAERLLNGSGSIADLEQGLPRLVECIGGLHAFSQLRLVSVILDHGAAEGTI